MQKRLVLTLTLLFALAIAGCGGTATTSATEATSPAETTTNGTVVPPRTSATAASSGSTTTTASASGGATDGTAASGWQEILSISGSDNANSEVFEITGKAVRVTFTLEGDMAIGAVYLFEEGHDFEDEGGIPDVMLTESGSKSIDVAKEPGRYFLCVKAANCEWSATVQEQK